MFLEVSRETGIAIPVSASSSRADSAGAGQRGAPGPGGPLCLLRQPETDQRRLGGRDRTSGAVIGLGVPAADLERAFAGAGWTYQSSA